MSENSTKKGGVAKTVTTLLLVFMILGGLVWGGIHLWNQRPWRTAISVNGRILTVGELELRAITLFDDAKKVGHILIPKGKEEEAMAHFRLEAAKKWIIKEVLLSEAVARGHEATPDDERKAFANLAKQLKSHKLTTDEYFTEGALPEEIKRRDFREVLLIEKLTTAEITDKISLSTEEINERMNELKKAALINLKPGEKPKKRWDRKYAIDQLRAERYRDGFRKLFRDLFPKSNVKAPWNKSLEDVNSVSAPIPEKKKAVKPVKTEKKVSTAAATNTVRNKIGQKKEASGKKTVKKVAPKKTAGGKPSSKK